MPQSSHLSDTLLDLQQRLQSGRQEIREAHERGLSGTKVSARMAALTDSLIVRLFEFSLEQAPPNTTRDLRSHLAIVCLGSHGRRQCAPYSDVDLMFLYKGMKSTEIAEVLRPLTQGIYDLGLQLGSSIRTSHEAIQLARDDVVICTSLIDARFLQGHQPLFDEFRTSFEKMVKRNSKALCRTFLNTREVERNQYGESVYLLEPHVKRSRGGLRDLNLLRWLGFAEFSASDPDRLFLLGTMSKFDYHRLQSAREYLLRLRNEMHFHAADQNDMLNRAEQLRIAEWLGHQHRSGLLPVEHFMRDYFRHTSHIWRLVRRKTAGVESESTVSKVLDPFFGKNVDGDFRVGFTNVSATSSGLVKLKRNLGDVLKLVELSAENQKPLDQQTYSTLLLAAPQVSQEISNDVCRQFCELIANPLIASDALFLLHELSYLEKLIPAMRHARSLLQFNQYHKYTVDEHCLRAVREVSHFAQRKDVLGRTYEEVENKPVLHLALLLHDLGKGFERDHSEVGKEIAEQTARRLQFDEESVYDISFLVHQHLNMSHLTFRRDTSDNELIHAFAQQVGTLDRLRMLFLLTCADLAAVGPEVLNNWKIDVLADVYIRTSKCLQAEDTSILTKEVETQRREVLEALGNQKLTNQWFQQQVAMLPTSYLTAHQADDISETLTRFYQLGDEDVASWCIYQPETQTIKCTAGARRGVGRGLFSSMAGALSSEGFQILEAATDVLADDVLLLSYTVSNPHSSEPPSEEQLEQVSQKMVDSVFSDKPPRFRKVWGQEQKEASQKLTELSNKITINNSLSEHYTVVEVFTFDRVGLLYSLAHNLHEMELIIRHAKIGTYLDQVVDVFYLTDREGRKIGDHATLESLREQLFVLINDD